MFHQHLPLINQLQFGKTGHPKCIDVIIPTLEESPRSGKFIADCKTDDDIFRLMFRDLLIESLQHLGKPFRLWKWDPLSGFELVESSREDIQTDPHHDPMFIVLATAKTGAAKLFEVDGAFEDLFELDRVHVDGHYFWETLISKDRVKNLPGKETANIENGYSAAIFVSRYNDSRELVCLHPADEKPDPANPKEMLQWFCRSLVSKKTIVRIIQKQDQPDQLVDVKNPSSFFKSHLIIAGLALGVLAGLVAVGICAAIFFSGGAAATSLFVAASILGSVLIKGGASAFAASMGALVGGIGIIAAFTCIGTAIGVLINKTQKKSSTKTDDESNTLQSSTTSVIMANIPKDTTTWRPYQSNELSDNREISENPDEQPESSISEQHQRKMKF